MNPIENFRNMAPEGKNRVYLITILFCVFLALLLGIAILSMSLSYPRTDAVEKNSGTAADSAVREISAGLLIKSEDTLSSALSYVETYYATTPSDKRSELVAKRFTELFYEEMRNLAGVKSNAAEIVTTSGRDEVVRVKVPETELKADTEEQNFIYYLKSLIKKEQEASVSANGSDMYIAYSKRGHYVELQNLEVTCQDGTRAGVNLRFTAPDDAAGDSAASYAGAVNAYAAVADGDIISTGGRNRIYGSVYAGNSIQARAGGELNLDGDTTVVRGDLAVSGSALLSILRGEVWAANLKTVTSGNSSSSYSSGINMDILADCFISGDMILENPGYSVHVSGNYYGYGTKDIEDIGGTVNEAAENSINGTEMDSILQRLLSGAYTILTNEDGTTTTILSDEARAAAEAEARRIASQAAMEAGGSTIRITGSNASTLVAYAPGQVLWLAATGYYEKAPAEGRSSITAENVPNGLGSGKSDTGAGNLETLYTYQFNGLRSGLDKNAAMSSPAYALAEHLLEISGLSGKNVIYTENALGQYEAHELEPIKGAAGNYIALQPKSEFKSGVLVTDCDVRLANINFNGIIITTGDIIMTGGAMISSDYTKARFTGVTDTIQNRDPDASNGRVEAQVLKSTPGRSSSKSEKTTENAANR